MNVTESDVLLTAPLSSVMPNIRKMSGVAAGQYVQQFEWDYAKYAVRQRLPALVSLIQGGVGKIEEEHRNLSMVFAEKNQALQVLDEHLPVDSAPISRLSRRNVECLEKLG